MRAPFQVLVFPYRQRGEEIELLIGRRAQEGYWQGIAGGGEDNESLLAATIRE